MKIVLAPDSFKGSLSAPQVCQALETGARRVFADAQFVAIPLADGGEGTLDALLTSTAGAIFKELTVRGPLGESVGARWGILPGGRAVIEMAQASGLDLVAAHQRNALKACSFGTGQLIKAALDEGCRDIILGIGGSATTDGGIGALSALGLRALDNRGRVLPSGGASLRQLANFDLRGLDPRLADTHFTLLCDVTNPLHGETGAAYIYAGQKGASPPEIEQLDQALRQLADVTRELHGHDRRNHPGAGAAGGMGFGMMEFCQARMRLGIDVILEVTGFASQLNDADLVLTGEGALDGQTLSGKTVAGVCRLAGEASVATLAFGGTVKLSGSQMDELGLVSAFSLVDQPMILNECLLNATELLQNSVERALRLWKAGVTHNHNQTPRPRSPELCASKK